MKLKKDLLEKVRKGEFIVENDNPCVIRELWTKAAGNDKYYVQDNSHEFKYNCTGILTGSSLFLRSIIKASELIEKEDYTKPLEEGQLCVFWQDNGAFLIDNYDRFLFNLNYHVTSNDFSFKYAMPITEEETINEIQEKINNYLKDK